MFLNKTWFTLKLQCDTYNWITAEYEVIFYINWGWITDFEDKIVTQNITAEDSFSTNWLFEYGHNLWLVTCAILLGCILYDSFLFDCDIKCRAWYGENSRTWHEFLRKSFIEFLYGRVSSNAQADKVIFFLMSKMIDTDLTIVLSNLIITKYEFI